MAPLRYMPISAFIPLLILWFGIYEKQKIAFLFLGVFVYLLPVVVSAIRAVPEELVQTALHARRQQGAGDVDRAAAAGAARDLRLVPRDERDLLDLRDPRGGGQSRSTGSGYMVELARTHQKASWSFAGLLVIGGIGLLTDFLIRMISSVLFRWRERRHERQSRRRRRRRPASPAPSPSRWRTAAPPTRRPTRPRRPQARRRCASATCR